MLSNLDAPIGNGGGIGSGQRQWVARHSKLCLRVFVATAANPDSRYTTRNSGITALRLQRHQPQSQAKDKVRFQDEVDRAFAIILQSHVGRIFLASEKSH